MTILLIIVALGCGAMGVMMLSTATMGVGIIALGCLAGILARIWQAKFDQKELLETLGKD